MTLEEDWEDLKRKLKVGDEVEGTVVHKSPFGDFIDIGVGFTTLLEVFHMNHLTPEDYKAVKYNPIGSKIKAYIADFTDEPNKQIRLTQKRLDKRY